MCTSLHPSLHITCSRSKGNVSEGVKGVKKLISTECCVVHLISVKQNQNKNQFHFLVLYLQMTGKVPIKGIIEIRQMLLLRSLAFLKGAWWWGALETGISPKNRYQYQQPKFSLHWAGSDLWSWRIVPAWAGAFCWDCQQDTCCAGGLWNREMSARNLFWDQQTNFKQASLLSHHSLVKWCRLETLAHHRISELSSPLFV